jgi:uncharacterized protein (TIGR03435 family)
MAQIERDGFYGNQPLAAFAIFLIGSVGAAQSFEVASIKPHPGEVTISADPAVRGSRVIGTASTLLDMITNAYGVRYDQVSGAPNWAGSDHYDVDAKAPGDTPPTAGQARLMMQALLAERFQLKLHRETRQVPVYALVVDKDGPKLKAGAVGVATGGSMRATTIGLRMETKNSGLDWLVGRLAGSAGRPVVDRTGLTGSYEYALDWFPANRVPPADSNVPSMFDAVREQLGLRLESSTGPQEFLVIDSAARPSEN